jgi:hypothetical protein
MYRRAGPARAYNPLPLPDRFFRGGERRSQIGGQLLVHPFGVRGHVGRPRHLSPNEGVRRAEEFALKALELDEHLTFSTGSSISPPGPFCQDCRDVSRAVRGSATRVAARSRARSLHRYTLLQLF